MARVRVVRPLACVLLGAVSVSACATSQPKLSHRFPTTPPHLAGKVPDGQGGRYKVGSPYQVAGVWYVPKEDPGYDQTGIASWYGADFNMKPTANGETFDMDAVSAAHTTLPLPSIVEVTNLENGRKLQVRVNDRGPFVGGRIIDLSKEAARQLGYDRAGVASVRVRYIGPAPLGPQRPAGVQYASATPAPQPVQPPAYQPPQPVYQQPAYQQPVYQTPAPPPVAAAPLPAAPAPVVESAVYRIQAGAFADRYNAQRVADQLAPQGTATIETIDRGGAPLYRVMLQSSGDEAEAWALRDRVAAVGYEDARVVRSY